MPRDERDRFTRDVPAIGRRESPQQKTLDGRDRPHVYDLVRAFVSGKDVIAELRHRGAKKCRGAADMKADAEDIGVSRRSNERRSTDLSDEHRVRLGAAVCDERIAEVEHELEGAVGKNALDRRSIAGVPAQSPEALHESRERRGRRDLGVRQHRRMVPLWTAAAALPLSKRWRSHRSPKLRKTVQ